MEPSVVLPMALFCTRPRVFAGTITNFGLACAMRVSDFRIGCDVAAHEHVLQSAFPYHGGDFDLAHYRRQPWRLHLWSQVFEPANV